MELRELNALVAIAEEQNFTRAAERLHLAQPALSRQLRRLETEVGLRLVDRTTRAVALTEAGHLLLARVRRIQTELRAAEAELDDLRGLRSGRVVFGVARATSAFPLEQLLRTFREVAPNVELVLQEGLSAAVTEALRADQVDVGVITPVDEDDLQGLHTTIVADERLVAILPPQHRLATRKRLRLADLKDEPFVVLPPHAVIRRRLQREAAAQGLQLQTPFEVAQIGRLRRMVSSGLGVSLLPESDARAPGDAVVVVPIAGENLGHRVLIARRADRHLTPAAQALLAVATA